MGANHPPTPQEHVNEIRCTVVELNGQPVAAPCAIEGRCMHPYPAPDPRAATAQKLTDEVLADAIDAATLTVAWEIAVGDSPDTLARMRAVLLQALHPTEPTT
jgi:hypothetical protein